MMNQKKSKLFVRRSIIGGCALLLTAAMSATVLASFPPPPEKGNAAGAQDAKEKSRAQDKKASEKSKAAGKRQGAPGDPYPLTTCAVLGGPLGGMGDPVVYDHDGREIKFCCKGCVGKFEANPDKYLKEVDAKIIEQQLEHYPMDTCLVKPDESLTADGEPVDLVYQNRLVRFCCKGCVREFKKTPEKFLKRLDEAVIEQQPAAHPRDPCAVGGAPLCGRGPPRDDVIHNRLVRGCCTGCVKSLRKDPQKYFAMIDADG